MLWLLFTVSSLPTNALIFCRLHTLYKTQKLLSTVSLVTYRCSGSCLLCPSLPTNALIFCRLHTLYKIEKLLSTVSLVTYQCSGSCLLCPSLPTNALIFCRLHTLWQCSSANRIHDSRAERQARQHLASLTFLHGFFFGGTGNWESLINKFPLGIWRPLSASRLQ